MYKRQPTYSCNTVDFTTATTGLTPTSYNWSFGDGSTGTGSSQSHLYQQAGYYPLSLVANYPSPYCNIATGMMVVIDVVADFTWAVDCSPNGNNMTINLVDLTDYLPGTTLNHNWFLNSSAVPFSNAANPSIDLPAGTTHTIRLDIPSPNSGTICSAVYTINVPARADANFTIPVNPICEGLPVVFNDLSLGNINSWFWNFGDGSTFGEANAERTYTVGATTGFPVSLTVQDEYGCTDTYTTSVGVIDNTVGGSISPAVPVSFCSGDSETLTVNPSGGTAPYTYAWNNVPQGTTSSIVVSTSGNYHVTITDVDGCPYTTTDVVATEIIIPQPVILGATDWCVGDELYLLANTGPTFTYQWEDVTNTPVVVGGNSPELTIPAGSPTQQNIQVTIGDPVNGCTAQGNIQLAVHNPPAIPSVSLSPVPACEGTPTTLTANSAGPNIQTYQWSTGAVGASTTVMNAGTYMVTAVDNNGCTSTGSGLVNELPDFCSFMCGCYEFCYDANGTEIPGIPGSFQQWYWIVDGSPQPSGSGPVQPLTLVNVGNYTVQLYVKTWAGCDDFSCEMDITINPCSEPCHFNYYLKSHFCAGNSLFTNFVITIPGGNPVVNTTVSSPGATVGGNNLGTITDGATNYVNLELIFPNGIPQTVCITFTFTFADGTSCSFTHCFDPNCERDKTALDQQPEPVKSFQFNMAPNPANGYTFFDYQFGEGTYEIRVTSMDGKLLYNQRGLTENGRLEFQSDHLAPGLYLVGIYQANQLVDHRKLVIIR